MTHRRQPEDEGRSTRHGKVRTRRDAATRTAACDRAARRRRPRPGRRAGRATTHAAGFGCWRARRRRTTRPCPSVSASATTRRRVVAGRRWVRAQLRGARLARDVARPRSRRPCPCRPGRPRACSAVTSLAVRSETARVRSPCSPRSEHRAHAHAVVGDRRGDLGHPQRRGGDLALADRARADREVVADLAGRRDRRRAARRRSRRGSLKPKRLGRLDEPLRAELGAQGREDGVAGVRRRPLRSVPPQDSPLAFSSSTPERVADRLDRDRSRSGLTIPSSSAPARVMILKVEPGGWGAE